MWYKACFCHVSAPVSAMHWWGPHRPKQSALSAIENLYKRETLVAHLTNFPLNFFMRFSQNISLYSFYCTVHSENFSQTLFDFKKLISGPIELKFSGKTLYAILWPRISSLVGLFLKQRRNSGFFSPFPWKRSMYNSFFTNFVWL